MADNRIDSFRAKLTGGGAFADRFQVELNWVGTSGLTEIGTFLIKAAALPGVSTGVIEQRFRGRVAKMAGDKTFEPWEITVINDTDFKLRNAFERWSELISSHRENTGLSNPNDYITNAQVYQLDRNGNKIKGYDFRNLWPSDISAIDLSADNADTIEEFTVTLQYDYFEASGVEGQNPTNLSGV